MTIAPVGKADSSVTVCLPVTNWGHRLSDPVIERRRKARDTPEPWAHPHGRDDMLSHQKAITGTTKRVKGGWQTLRQHMTTQSAGWQRMVTAQRNWKALAKAIKPYFDELHQPGIALKRRYYLERIDQKHRYGPELERARRVWLNGASNNTPFFEWLSVNEREIIKGARDGVIYMDATQRRQFEVQIAGGRIASSDDEKLLAVLAEFDSNELMFVAGLDGGLYAFPKVRYELHHSSFLSGGKVRMAGTFLVDDKLAIRAVSNASGHYAVGETDVEAFLLWLVERGVGLDAIVLILVSAGGNAMIRRRAGLWLRDRREARLREERRRANMI